MDKDKRKNINALIGKINKSLKMEAVHTLRDVEESLRIKFYKTPSHEINSMLSGGIPKGKIVELFGLNSSGKTSLAIEVIAKAQREDEDFYAAWIETENSLDIDYLAYFGIDTERLVIVHQSDNLGAEACMEIIRGFVSSGQFGIVVLNSVAALNPKKEIEDDLDKQNMAMGARLLSKFLRITTGTLAKSETTLILINQIRATMNQYAPVTTTGKVA